MRIRTVKPEFWQDEEISDLPAETALLAIGLLNYADDEGYFKFHPKLIEASIFPLRELSLSIHGMLSELSNMGFITLHEGSDGKKYGHISNFLKHQRVNRPAPSKISPILCKTLDNESSVMPHEQISDDSLTERNREQGKEVEQGTGKGLPSPPSAEVVEFLWPLFPKRSRERSSKKQLSDEWKRIKASDRPELDTLKAALAAWVQTEKWKGGFSEGSHLWVKRRQWDSIPEPDESTRADLGNRIASIAKLENKTNKSEEEKP